MKTVNAVVENKSETKTQKESVMTKLWNSLKNGTKSTTKVITWSVLGTLFISALIPFIPGAALGGYLSSKLDLFTKNFTVATSVIIGTGLITSVAAFIVAPVATLVAGASVVGLATLYVGYTKVKAFFAKRKEAK